MGCQVVYLQLKKRLKARPDRVLRLRDLAHVLVDDDRHTVKDLPVYRTTREHGNLAVVELIDIVRLIRKHYPSLDVRSVGPVQTIVELEEPPKIPPKVWVGMVWVLLFIGSGLAIMNFHTDVSMKAVHERIYFLMTGKHDPRPLILQIPYSIGIGAGMILFFNHLFKRKFNEEPSPLELEVFLYQQNMDQYVIDHEKVKGRSNVDGPSR